MGIKRIFKRSKPYRESLKSFLTAENVHIMHNDKFNRVFIDFINKNFDKSKHAFLFYGGYSEDEFAIPSYDNVIKIPFGEYHFLRKLFILRAKRIIQHGFYMPDATDFYCRNQAILPKTYWVIWSGDMYDDFDRQEAEEFIKKKQVVQKMKALVTLTGQEIYDAKQLYKFEGSHFLGMYVSPIDKNLLDKVRNNGNLKKSSTVKILVNHCSGKNTIEALYLLEKFKNYPIEVHTIVSYGDLEQKDKICEVGNKLFNGKFFPVSNYLSPAEYADYLSNIDILLMNHKSQQGLGTIWAMLYLGKKVYIKKGSPIWNEFIERYKFDIFNTELIMEENFDELIEIKENYKNNNFEKVNKFMFNNEYRIQLWEKIFNS